MRRYTIVDYFGYDLPPRERMRAIRAAGFDGVILLWADYFDADYRDFPAYARQAGLFVENAHAPYQDAGSLWTDTLEGEACAEHIIRCLEDCRDYGIPTLVMHPINGRAPLPEGSVGLERFRRICDAAERTGVNLAIENQGSADYIGYVFEHIQSDRLRFCFDSGHERFYSPGVDLLSLYGDRLAALHLHDNNGKEDAHALPFTGAVDWGRIAAALRAADYRGAIALEVLNKGFESIKDPVEFLSVALNRAKAIL
ncbi:MAG: sugar phosphate isomerase/epimerase [Christensenellaceae bacterium]|nr:sugar phosphate isomerase/epimerase [Christensenellaceae bacterium]